MHAINGVGGWGILEGNMFFSTYSIPKWDGGFDAGDSEHTMTDTCW